MTERVFRLPKSRVFETSAVAGGAKAHIISITYGPAKQLRECFIHHEPRVPHIWPGFGQMWELAALGPEVLKRNQHSRPSIR
jgi:hypothetical protein